MIDCPNGAIRDQLPDYLHDELPAAARASVAAHVAGCAACSAELALLSELRGSMQDAAPVVDVDAVVAALPSPQRKREGARPVTPSRWRQLNWRIAASIAVLAAGSGAAAILGRGSEQGIGSEKVAGGSAVVRQGATTAVAIDAYLSDASTVELEALLHDLESFDGLPAGEPELGVPATGDAEEGL
jgi:anti-sigma factor RsiW